MKWLVRVILTVLIFGLPAALPAQLLASNAATVSGTITDTLGAVIQNAQVELVEIAGGTVVQTARTDARGHYSFAVASQGRFRIRAEAASFQPAASQEKFAGGAHPAEIDLTLSPSRVAQQIVVTATGVPTPEAQTGASISVIDEPSLAIRRDVEQELRIEPGAQVTRTGQIGALTSLNVRGGYSDMNKVLIDGIPANDIGGAMNFANLSASGYEKAELYRGPNSALFGSDALASVLSITTRRGITPLPEVAYAIDGGTLGTVHQDGNLGGAWRRFDYFSDVSFYDTQNSTPNSEFHNGSYLGNLGWQILPGTELRATVRRSVSAFNDANAIALYGIPDDGVSREHDTAFGVTLENHATPRWHNLLRYAGLRLRSGYTDSPTGISALDIYGDTIYLGDVQTLRGANGYQVPCPTGGCQGILQYGPAYSEPSLTNRDSIYAQSDYRLNSKLAGLFAFRYEAESGYTAYSTTGYSYDYTTSRGNYSYIMQMNGGLWNRLYYTAGAGLENNAVFGFAAAPRASLAYYLLKPDNAGILNGTRLVFNFGKGIKEPSIYVQGLSLYDQLQALSITQPGILPIGAELSRTYDGGVQQTLLHGKARISLTFFHNEFSGLPEYVPTAALGGYVSPSLIPGLQLDFIPGAYVNSLSYRALGTELEAEYHITRNLSLRGGWTYTDAVVQHSFSGMLDNASYNTSSSFSNIPIGAFSPLVGARPFHIAPHTGFFSVDWNSGRYLLRMTGSLVSRRDDSDFLQDSSYDANLLLPNRNLDPSYQKLDLYGSFRFTRRVSAYATMENLLNQHYSEAIGYPALPFTIRSGMQFRFGGDSWKL